MRVHTLLSVAITSLAGFAAAAPAVADNVNGAITFNSARAKTVSRITQSEKELG